MQGGNGHRPDAGELGAAISEGDLTLYFQPIVSLADRSATMLEALPRWPHGDGILAPEDFIALAQESSLLVPLERWAIAAAVRQLRRWRTGTAGELEISLNLSEEHVYETDLVSAVCDAYPAEEPPQRLGFEISEGALVEAGGRSLEKLQSLADLGVSLIIDDYRNRSDVSLLRALPTTALKISRGIVENIPDSPEDCAAAESAIATGRELGLATIASGVESLGQLSSLREMGCQYAQGFLFSVPMPAEVLEERMVSR